MYVPIFIESIKYIVHCGDCKSRNYLAILIIGTRTLSLVEGSCFFIVLSCIGLSGQIWMHCFFTSLSHNLYTYILFVWNFYTRVIVLEPIKQLRIDYVLLCVSCGCLRLIIVTGAGKVLGVWAAEAGAGLQHLHLRHQAGPHQWIK